MSKLLDNATPRPWQVTPDGFRITDEPGLRIIAYTANNLQNRTSESRANCYLIVQAVNSLDERTKPSNMSKMVEELIEVEHKAALADELAAALINLLVCDALRHMWKSEQPQQMLDAEAALAKYNAVKY